jgi:threonine synthase
VNGTYVAVSDAEILEALRESAERTGVFAEPAGATAAAGVRRAVQDGVLDPSVSVAVIITGNGLKDPQTALSAVTGPIDVRPDVASVLAELD